MTAMTECRRSQLTNCDGLEPDEWDRAKKYKKNDSVQAATKCANVGAWVDEKILRKAN